MDLRQFPALFLCPKKLVVAFTTNFPEFVE